MIFNSSDERMLDIYGVITLNDSSQITLTADDIVSYQIYEAGADDGIPLGTARAAQFTLTLSKLPALLDLSLLDGAEAHMYIGIGGGEMDYVDFGVWYIDSASAPEQQAIATLPGFDALAAKFDITYEDSAVNYPMTLGYLMGIACLAAGITLATPTFHNSDIVIEAMPFWSNKVTLRDIISYIAACTGGFARIARNGQLEIVALTGGQSTAVNPDTYMQYTPSGGRPFTLNAIDVQFVSDPESDATNEPAYTRFAVDPEIEADATNTVQIDSNPLLTPAIMTDLIDVLGGFTAAGVSITWVGDPAVRCGDSIDLTDMGDAERTYYITQQSIVFDGGFQMTSGCAVPTAAQNSGSQYTTSANLFTSDGKLHASRIADLDRKVILATIARIERIIAEETTTDRLYAALADLIVLTAKQITAGTIITNNLYAEFSRIMTLVATRVTAETVTTNEFYAAVAHMLSVAAGSITAGTIEADQLASILGQFISLFAKTGTFDFATAQNFVAGAMSLEHGTAGQVHITNLTVTQANMLNATVMRLVMPGTDGKYYAIVVGSDGVLHTEEVTATAGEIAAGQLSDGRQIVATTINAESINGQTVNAQSAAINTILATALAAGKITAGEALIASATIPALYTTAINAIGNTIDINANETVNILVGAAQAAQDQADYATAYDSPTPPSAPVAEGKVWRDRGATPMVDRRWRGADVPTSREYALSATGNPVAVDNSRGDVVGMTVSAPDATGDVALKRTGKNIFNPNSLPGTWVNRGSLSVNGDTITLSATGSDCFWGSAANVGIAYSSGHGPIFPVGVYSVSLSDTRLTKNFVSFFNSNLVSLGYQSKTGSSFSFTPPAGAMYFTMRMGCGTSISGDVYNTTIQLEPGSTATPYEPYIGADYTIPQGGSVEVAPLQGINVLASTAMLEVEYTGTGWEVVNDQSATQGEIAGLQSMLSKWFTFDNELGLIIRKPAYIDGEGVAHPASIWRTITDEVGYHIWRDDMATPVGSFARDRLIVDGTQMGEIVARKTSTGGWVWTDA